MKRTKFAAITAALLIAVLLCTGCSSTSLYLDLPKYKGIEVYYGDIAASDAKVQERIDAILESRAEGGYVTDRGIQDGDTVVLNYEGYVDGIQFDGGTATGSSLVVGVDSFIDGFVEGLMGAKTGDELTLECKFPDPYQNKPSLAGKDATFYVEIVSIHKTVIPEFDNAFVRSLDIEGCSTVEEYSAYVKKLLEDENLTEASWEAVLAGASFKVYPTKRVNERGKEMDDYYTGYASNAGMSLLDYLSENYGVTEEEYEADRKEYGERMALEDLVFEHIIEKEKIEVSDEQYTEKGTEYATSYGYESLEAFEEAYGRDLIEESVAWDIMLTIIKDNAVILENETGE